MAKSRITKTSEVQQLGTILGVWAHPDDETYGCAGLMAQAVKNGQSVVCVTATKGEAGSQDETLWPSATLAEVRAKELTDALGIIGVTEHHWLGFLDGACSSVPDSEAVSRIVALIKAVKPDTVLTFEPDGITGHDDHKAISRWTTLAVKQTGGQAELYYYADTVEQYNDVMRELDKQFNIYFNTDKPNLVRREDCDIALALSPELHDLKIQALKAMPSQTAAMFESELGKHLPALLDTETFVKAYRFSEILSKVV